MSLPFSCTDREWIVARACEVGDGRADSAIFRPSTGEWWISQTRDGHKVAHWGQAGDIPVPADFDDDASPINPDAPELY